MPCCGTSVAERVCELDGSGATLRTCSGRFKQYESSHRTASLITRIIFPVSINGVRPPGICLGNHTYQLPTTYAVEPTVRIHLTTTAIKNATQTTACTAITPNLIFLNIARFNYFIFLPANNCKNSLEPLAIFINQHQCMLPRFCADHFFMKNF